MKIAIHAREIKLSFFETALEIFKDLLDNHIEIYVSNILRDENPNLLKGLKNIKVFEDINIIKPDTLFSIGGDGTILESLSIVGASEIPILGINAGRLGFLATTPRERIKSVINHFLTKNYTLDARTILSLENEKGIFEGKNFALNEFSILRKETSSMITIKTYLDDNYLNTYWADGLIISTPTGSTAYSLSCGGPILHPQTKNFIITPVNPHNLNMRPFIVPDSSEITLEVENKNTNYLVCLDSRYRTIEGNFSLKIKKASFNIHLIKTDEDSFFDSLRSKLSWGLDKRN